MFNALRWTDSIWSNREFTSVRVSPCCVLPSCALLLHIMSCYQYVCTFSIDCTAEIKYIYKQVLRKGAVPHFVGIFKYGSYTGAIDRV